MTEQQKTPTTAEPGSNVSTSFLERLQQRREDAKWTPDVKKLDPGGFFDIPWKDVTVYKDSANASKEDPVTFGPAATAAIQRMYAEFGVTGWPETWGQFMGSVAYCKELSAACNYPRQDKEDDAIYFGAVLSVAEEYSPELFKPIKAYHDGKIEKLKEIFTKKLGMEACSKHFDPMEGWDSNPAK